MEFNDALGVLVRLDGGAGAGAARRGRARRFARGGLALAVLGGLFADAAGAQTLEADRAALVAIYDATGGASWTNNEHWKTTRPVGDWHGVTTTWDPGAQEFRVTRVLLRRNNLSGSLPPEVFNLTQLQHLYLEGNHLSGSIPSGVDNLTRLEVLSIHDNALTGSIPSEVGNLTGLTQILLSNNQLSGSIPSTLGNLTDLTELHLQDNRLSGSIPSGVGNLTRLRILFLYNNELTGPIPATVGNITNLEELDLNENRLEGPLPPELGRLQNLYGLQLWNNRLTGAIPPEWGNMRSLRQLYASGNRLEGTLPSTFGNLADLRALSVWGNANLEGEIPSEFVRLAQLSTLWLNYTSVDCDPLSYDPPDQALHDFLAAPGLDYQCDSNKPPAPAPPVITTYNGALGVSWGTGASGRSGAVSAGGREFTVFGGGAAATAYELQWWELNAGSDAAQTRQFGASQRSYTIRGLDNGSDYRVRLRARNAGGAGPWSAAASGKPSEDAPLPPSEPGPVGPLPPRPVVTLHLSSASIAENGGFASVTATLDVASDATTTVTVSAEPAPPAVAGDFFLSADRTLTIAPGRTSSTGEVAITAVDNEVADGDKAVTVSGAASNARGVMGPADVPLTITDDEMPEPVPSVPPPALLALAALLAGGAWRRLRQLA